MAFDKFPFAFDAEKLGEMFKMPEMDKMFDPTKMPAIDMDVFVAASQKNVDAFMAANKVAVAGYQEIAKRQVALFEEAIATLKDQVSVAQGQPVSAESATQAVETMKTSVEKAMADAQELAELAQKANTEAFEIVKARFEEAVAEFQDAAKKLAA